MTTTRALGVIAILTILFLLNLLFAQKNNHLKQELKRTQAEIKQKQQEMQLLQNQLANNEAALKALEQARAKAAASANKARAKAQAAKPKDDAPLAPVLKQTLETLHD